MTLPLVISLRMVALDLFSTLPRPICAAETVCGLSVRAACAAVVALAEASTAASAAACAVLTGLSGVAGVVDVGQPDIGTGEHDGAGATVDAVDCARHALNAGMRYLDDGRLILRTTSTILIVLSPVFDQ